MNERSFEREADLLARLNAVEVNGRPVRDWNEDGMLVWQHVQQSLFWEDIPAFFAAPKSVSSGGGSITFSVVLSDVVAVLVTAYATLRILLRRPSVFVFAIDKVSDSRSKSDARIAPLYRALERTRASYLECFHTMLGPSLLAHLRARCRSALYLEAFDVLWRLRNLFRHAPQPTYTFTKMPVGTPEEIAFMKRVVCKYLAAMPRHAFRARLLTRILRRARPKTAFLVDDTRHYHDVVAALRQLGIPSYAIQHGRFTPHMIGWRRIPGAIAGESEKPDKILVWNSYWKKTLEALDSVFPNEAILVGGNPAASAPLARTTRAPYSVLVPFETVAPFEVMRRVIARVQNAGMRVLFKPRLDWPIAVQLASYGLSNETELVRDLASYTGGISLALGVYSTLLYELVAQGIPVAFLAVLGTPRSALIAEGLAEEVSADDERLPERLAQVAHLSDAEVARRAASFAAPQTLETTIVELIFHALSH